MLDAGLRKVIDPLLKPVAGGLVRLGCSANFLTVAGFLLGVGAWGALAWQHYGLALGLILANRLFDGLDGLAARVAGPTDLGGFLDIVLDFLFYSGVPFFFAVGQPEFALPAAFLIFSFVGTGSSFLAFAAIAAKRGTEPIPQPNKAIHYLGGLTEGGETIALFALICLVPAWFPLCAWIFGSLCWLTTLTRIAAGIGAFHTPTKAS